MTDGEDQHDRAREAPGEVGEEVRHALGQDRLEQYLALLTSDGPLVPVDGDAAVPTEVQR